MWVWPNSLLLENKDMLFWSCDRDTLALIYCVREMCIQPHPLSLCKETPSPGEGDRVVMM